MNIKNELCDEHWEEVKKIKETVYGNGKKGILERIERIETIVTFVLWGVYSTIGVTLIKAIIELINGK